MALEGHLKSLDGVDEALRAHYTEKDDGTFELAVNNVESLRAVQGLKNKNAELLDTNVKVKKQLEALGVETPEEIEGLRQKLEEAGKKDSGGDQRVKELEAKLAQASENAQKEIAKAQEAAKAKEQAAQQYFLDGELTRAITSKKGKPHMLARELKDHLKVDLTDDGAFTAKVIGKDGQPRIKDSAGNAYTVEDLVEEYKANPEWGGAFEAEGRSGSGAPPTGGNGTGSVKSVRANDREAFGANIEAIAKGEVTVTQD